MTHGWYEVLHDFAGPCATVIAAIVAATITFYFNRAQTRISREQARIAKEQARLASIRLQHDLYDRRYEIFSIIWALLVGEIIPSTNISDEGFYKFVRGTAHAAFLVNKDVQDYLALLRKECLRLKRIKIRINQTQPQTPERAQAVNDEMELMNWFEAQLEISIKKFEPLLSLEYYREI